MDTKKVLPFLGVGVAVLVGLAVWLGIRSFSAPTAAPTTQSIAADNFVAEMAKKSGGDFSKLSPTEQQKLNQMSMGHGEAMIKSASGK
jgi:hypothetical protein